MRRSSNETRNDNNISRKEVTKRWRKRDREREKKNIVHKTNDVMCGDGAEE